MGGVDGGHAEHVAGDREVGVLPEKVRILVSSLARTAATR